MKHCYLLTDKIIYDRNKRKKNKKTQPNYLARMMLETFHTFSPCSSAVFIFFNGIKSLFFWQGAVMKQNIWLMSRHKKVNKIPLAAAEKFFCNLSWTTKVQMLYPIHEHLNANFLWFRQQEQSPLNTMLFIMERLNAKQALTVIAHRILRIKKCKNQSHSSSTNLPKSHYILMYIPVHYAILNFTV